MDNGMEALQDVWPANRRPGRHETQVDQTDPDASTMKRFAASLLSQEPAVTGADFFKDAPAHMLSVFQGECVEVMQSSFPINMFNSLHDQLPTFEHMSFLIDATCSHYLPSCPFLSTLPPSLFTPDGPRYLTLATASVGAISLGDFQNGLAIWHLASKTLMSILGIDNRHTRNVNVSLAWLSLGAVGVLSGDPKIHHVTNSVHSLAETISKNLLSKPHGETLPRGIPASEKSNIVFHHLLIDTLRSLHLGTPASTISASSQVSLEEPYVSLSTLTSRTLFAGPQAEWPPPTPANALVILVLILNHIIIWAREMLPLAHASMSAGIQGHRQLETETHKSVVRLRRAIEKWEACYKDTAPPEVLALFFFCKLHLCLPRLHRGSSHIECDATGGIPPEAMETLYEKTEGDSNELQESTHFAWLVLEQAPDRPDMTPIWLPIIMYFSGLAAWRSIRSYGPPRLGVSLQVLKLYAQKLRRMSWPCCAGFALTLEKLSEQR